MSEDKKEENNEIEKRDGAEGEVEEVEKAIKKLSDKKPEVASEFMAMMGMGGSMSNPLHHKMDSTHISKLLEIAADHDKREYELQKTSQSNSSSDRKSNRRYFFATFVTVIFLVVFLLYLFQDKPDVLIPALTGLGGLVGGFLGGWGFGKRNPS